MIPNLRAYLYIALAAVLAIGIAGTGIYVWSLQHRLHDAQQAAQVATAANTALNIQVKTGNDNLKSMKEAYDAQNQQFEDLRAKEQQQARHAAEQERQLQALLAARPDPGTAAALNQRLRAALERIQGHPFDAAGAAAFAAPAGNAAYCVDRTSAGNLVDDLDAAGRTLDLIYGTKDPSPAGP